MELRPDLQAYLPQPCHFPGHSSEITLSGETMTTPYKSVYTYFVILTFLFETGPHVAQVGLGGT